MTPQRKGDDWQDLLATGRLNSESVSDLRALLRDSPAEYARFEEELALNRLLEDLPRADAPSNLASRVLQQIELEDRKARRTVNLGGHWWHGLRRLRPMALTAVAALVLTGWWQFRIHERRVLAESLSTVSHVAAVPGVDSLENFDAIRLLRTTSQPGDVELIAALNTP